MTPERAGSEIISPPNRKSYFHEHTGHQGADVLNTQATHQLSGMAAESAASRRAASQGTCAYPWPGGDAHGSNDTFVDLKVIATPKHRLRRPEDRSH